MVRIVKQLFREDEFKVDLTYNIIEKVMLSIVVLLIPIIFFTNYRFGHVPTESMDPTIHAGDIILIDQANFNINRGDIVYFILEDEEYGSERMVKRVIGLPEDRLEIINGVLYINDEVLDEEYIINKQGYDYNFGEIYVPKGKYFLMGDNRGNSLDSRYFGSIEEENIKGVIKKIISSPKNKN